MFYANYIKLCNSVDKSPSAVAEEIGIKRSTVTRWKSGKSQTDANIQKVADYFNVSVDFLKGNEQKEAPPAIESGERSPDDAVLLDAFNKADETTKELIRRALGLK